MAAMDTAHAQRLADLMARFGAEPYQAGSERDPRFLVLSPRFDEALAYAIYNHREQPRKGTRIPYLCHLLGVAATVLVQKGTEDQAIAALLHDTVEDCGSEHEPVIRELFGAQVLDIVLACTDARVPRGGSKPPWRRRKEAYIAHLRALPPAHPALLVSCADKLDNAKSIRDDLRLLGAPLWLRFRQTPEEELWYYDELVDAFGTVFPGPLTDELRAMVRALERAHRETAQ